MGVEEEFLLVGIESGETVSRADAVLRRAGRHPADDAGGGFHPELYETQLEAATGVCRELGELHAQLRWARAGLAAAARAEGLRLISAGVPVLPSRPPRPAPGERFRRIALLYGDVIADYEACGCHVHVGVADRETAVAVVNHLRPWLPTLLALSVNSPISGGRDSGFASRRMVDQSRFPGAGVPPWFASAAAYHDQVARLVECGVLVDDAMTFWLARPSAKLPTVEVRAADAAATAGEAVLQAALTRALVSTALAALGTGREAPKITAVSCATALWSAARHGLDGSGFDPFEERRVPAGYLLDRLVALVTPALEDSGDLPAVRALLKEVAWRGTGAARQRRAMAGGPKAVVDLLAAQTTAASATWIPAEGERT
ncbi:putative glutamate--cysteine ligase 2 [Microtetraspora sp. NBRC 13810]|nr:putative glutamate--cysteine ligase 2 [Microtetraspora sp. NBRC 13810]